MVEPVDMAERHDGGPARRGERPVHALEDDARRMVLHLDDARLQGRHDRAYVVRMRPGLIDIAIKCLARIDRGEPQVGGAQHDTARRDHSLETGEARTRCRRAAREEDRGLAAKLAFVMRVAEMAVDAAEPEMPGGGEAAG